jgi:FAD binding domain
VTTVTNGLPSQIYGASLVINPKGDPHMATTTGAPAGTLNGALDDLRATVRGEVNAPDVRPVFNAMHRGQPAVTISCTGTADVIEAVNFAREQNLPVAVRGGGHSIAGLSSTDGGVLIDLAPMSGVVVDPERKRAYVQGGAALRPRRAERSRFRHRRRRPHARRRLRLAPAQVRTRLRQPRRGAGRLRRRPDPDGVGGLQPRPVLGAARRRRQLRRRHLVHLRPEGARAGGRVRRRHVSDRGDRRGPA